MYPWSDPTRSVDERIQALMSAMTVREKIAQLGGVRLLSQRLEGNGSQEPITKLYKTKLVVQETVGPCNE